MSKQSRSRKQGVEEISVNDVSRLTNSKKVSVPAVIWSKKSVSTLVKRRRSSYVISDLLNRDQLDKMKDQEAANSYFHGRRLDDIPKPNAGVVRIFVSSTFSDMQLERNALMIHVYPRMRAYCRQQHGLEFQVVDMRWGVTEEATDNHMAPLSCMREIEECQKRSIGPNFLILMGQRYGWVPLHYVIEKLEFETICNHLEKIPEQSNELKLLKEWYLEDTNTSRPCYILQRISKKLPDYFNQRDNDVMQEARSKWSDQYTRMQRAIMLAVSALVKSGTFSEEYRNSHAISVTHMEAQTGLLDVADAGDHCLAIARTLTSMPKGDLLAISPYLDTVGFSVDTRNQGLLSNLRESILNRLPQRNKIVLDVAFNDYIHMQPFNRQENSYLQNIINDLSNKIATLVSRAASTQKRIEDELENEVVHHLRLTKELSAHFTGCEDIVKKVSQYVSSVSESAALVIYGPAGCGRTSTLAVTHLNLLDELDDDAFDHVHFVVRYLGTTMNSSSLGALLRSVCQQLVKINLVSSTGPIPSKLAELCDYFVKLLKAVPKSEKLVLMLDALESLDRESNSTPSLQWLPSVLPSNVKMVLSTDDFVADERRSWLQRLIKHRSGKEGMLQLGMINKSDAVAMLNAGLRRAKRKLSDKQQSVAESCLEGGALPLYVRSLVAVVEQWRSYDGDLLKPPQSVSACVDELLSQLERSFGSVFVAHALGCLAAARVGLSEAELEDMLSLDDQVLNELYEWHLPPIRRLPTLMLARLVQSLSGYVVERQSGNTTVLQWQHTSIRQAVSQRYLRDPEARKAIHSLIADYFLGTWAHRLKPFQYSRAQLSRFKLDDKTYESDRLVYEQPFIFAVTSSNQVFFNVRKVVELPYSLLQAGRLEEALKECFFCFAFLYARIVTSSVESLIADLQDYPDYRQQPELLVLLSSLKLSASELHTNPTMLGAHLLARLMPYYQRTSPRLHKLLQECDTEGVRQCALVPVHHCMQTPGGPLQHSFESGALACYGVCIAVESDYVFAGNNKLRVWSLDSGTLYQESKFTVNGLIQTLRLTPDSRLLVAFTSNNQVLLCTVASFEILEPPTLLAFLQTLNPLNDRVIDVEVSNTDLFVWTGRAYCRYCLQTAQVKAVDLAAALAPSGHIIVLVSDFNKSIATQSQQTELIVTATLAQNVNRQVTLLLSGHLLVKQANRNALYGYQFY